MVRKTYVLLVRYVTPCRIFREIRIPQEGWRKLRFNATWSNKFRLIVLCCIWLFFKYLINNRLIVSYLEEKRNLNQIYNRRPLPLKILVYPRNYSKEHFLDSKILLDLDKRIFDSIHMNDGKKNHKYM